MNFVVKFSNLFATIHWILAFAGIQTSYHELLRSYTNSTNLFFTMPSHPELFNDLI